MGTGLFPIPTQNDLQIITLLAPGAVQTLTK